METRVFNSFMMGLVLAGAGIFCPSSQARDLVPDEQRQPQSPASQGSNHKHYEVSPEANQPGPDGQSAPGLQNLGVHTFPVSTQNKEAQLFINQGINLAYGFNHAEAHRAFREAARLDPALAMAY